MTELLPWCLENPCAYLVNDLQGRELSASPAAGGADLPWQGVFVSREKCHMLVSFSCVVVCCGNDIF